MKHILLVNGHDDSRNILRTALRHHGYRVSDVGDSESALEHARRERPDLVVFELYLHPLDGQELIEQLRQAEETSSMPIVCLTSRVMESDRQMALDTGADVFLPTPLTPREVIDRVESLLGQPAGG